MVRRSLPVFPDNRTSSVSVGMSQRCQHETHAPQQIWEFQQLCCPILGAGVSASLVRLIRSTSAGRLAIEIELNRTIAQCSRLKGGQGHPVNGSVVDRQVEVGAACLQALRRAHVARLDSCSSDLLTLARVALQGAISLEGISLS
jgi:hypothetical protein